VSANLAGFGGGAGACPHARGSRALAAMRTAIAGATMRICLRLAVMVVLAAAACSQDRSPAASNDAGFVGTGVDAGAPTLDAGAPPPVDDAGTTGSDAGQPPPPPDDGGAPPPSPSDGGSTPPADAGTAVDAGTSVDGGTAVDGGAASAAPYRVIDLGTLGDTYAVGIGVTNDGAALVWTPMRSSLVDIATGASTDVSAARNAILYVSGMNESGDIAYTDHGARTCNDQHVLVRSRAGAIADLGAPPHGDLTGIDCSQRGGWVLGFRGHNVIVTWRTHDGWRALLNDGTSWTTLPGFGVNTMAAAVNAAGDAVIHDDYHVYLVKGGATQLAGLSADGDDLSTVNASDQVAGTTRPAQSPKLPALNSNGATQTLPLPVGHDTGAALAVNAGGIAVGCTSISWDQSRGASHAVAWQAGTAYDLNEMVATHDLHLSCARAIADDGTIVGDGFAQDGSGHAFALVPQAPLASGGGTPEQPTPPAFAGREERATTLAIDAMNVYWLSITGQLNGAPPGWVLRAAPKAGGAPRTLASGQGGSDQILVDAQSAYLATGRLLRVPIGGGAPVDLGVAGMGEPTQDDANLYTFIGGQYEGQPNTIVRVPKSGGAATTLATTDQAAVDLALSGGYLYWAANRVFSRMPVGGGPIEQLASDPNLCPGHLRIAGDFAYVHCGGVMRVPLAGGSAQPLWSPPAYGGPGDLDYSQGWVFWNQSSSSAGFGCLWRSWADGSSAPCLDSSAASYGGVRVDDSSIWFIRDYSIYRLPR
jgi:hypothetical protein